MAAASQKITLQHHKELFQAHHLSLSLTSGLGRMTCQGACGSARRVGSQPRVKHKNCMICAMRWGKYLIRFLEVMWGARTAAPSKLLPVEKMPLQQQRNDWKLVSANKMAVSSRERTSPAAKRNVQADDHCETSTQRRRGIPPCSTKNGHTNGNVHPQARPKVR